MIGIARAHHHDRPDHIYYSRLGYWPCMPQPATRAHPSSGRNRFAWNQVGSSASPSSHLALSSSASPSACGGLKRASGCRLSDSRTTTQSRPRSRCGGTATGEALCPHRRDEEIMDSDDAMIIKERSHRRRASGCTASLTTTRSRSRFPCYHRHPGFRATTTGWIHHGSCNDGDGDCGGNIARVGLGSVACCPVAVAVQGADLSSAMRMVGLDCNCGLKIL
jgi:hypothetical protein